MCKTPKAPKVEAQEPPPVILTQADVSSNSTGSKARKNSKVRMDLVGTPSHQGLMIPNG